MALLGSRLYVALDAAAVSAAWLSRGLARRRVEVFARSPLPPLALCPSGSGANILRSAEVRDAMRRAVDRAGGSGPATIVLPDGVARLALVDVPAGADAGEYVRFRLAPSLPWPASEAIVNTLPLPGGRAVGAAVRRPIVTEYEHAARAAALQVERVHLAPLLALEGLLHRARSGVFAILGDAALCLAVFRGGELRALSNRRRDRSGDGDEAERLLGAARRAMRGAGDGNGSPDLVPVGAGALDLTRELHERWGIVVSRPAGRGIDESLESAEAAWLLGLLA